MNEETKNRIAAINSGIIPEGYKKTKVGIVPVEWEVTKLSEYLYVNKEKNTELKYSKNDVFSISGEYGIVNQIDFLGRSFAGVSVEPYRVVYPENIVYTKSPLKVNPYGIIKSNQRKDTGIVSTLYAVYHCKENVLSKYIEYYFGLDVTLNNYLLPLVNIGSKHDMKISDENVLKGLVVFPPLPEQQKIVEILSVQDKLIELQEKKIEQLKELKKAYLQKMFPKKGSKYPELRFKGFTAPWEQRKLGEISESFEYGLNAAATEYDGKHKYIRITDIDDSTHLFIQDNLTSPDIDFSTADDYLLQEGDVLFARTGASVGKTYIYRSSDGDLYFAGFLIRAKIKSDYDADFVFQNTLTDNYDSYIRITSQRSGQPGVNAQEYANFALSVPCLAEQKKIGAYFSNLDNLITLHQRKSEQEKQKKKALMQLLLTGKVRCI